MGNTKRKENTSINVYLRIIKYVFPYWSHLSLSMICAVLYSIFSGLSIYFVIPLLQTLFAGGTASEFIKTGGSSGFIESAKVWLNTIINYLVFADNQLDSLLRVCFILVIGFLLRNFFSYFQSYTMAHVEQGLMMDIRNDLFKHIHNLSIGYFSNERTGNLISRVTNDVTVVNSGVSASFVTLVKEPFSAAIYLVLAIAISWKLTVISFLAFPFALVVISWIGLKLHKESRILQEKMADITSVLQETIFGEKIVKAFNMEEFENKRFQNETKKYFKTILKMTRIRNLSSPVTEFVSIAAGVIIVWYGGTQVLIDKTLSPSEFLGFFFIIFQIMSPIKELTTVTNRIQESTAAGKRIFEILDMDPYVKNIPNAINLEEFKSEIIFENVSFQYEEEQSGENSIVLKNVNLSVSKGEIIAIVGPSGAGKSTLVDLIPRFYDPNQGKIKIDSFDIRNVNIKSLRSKIGIVTQETILFNDTIRNNIAYGLTDFSQEKIIDAAKAANAHNFILEASDGYDTMIGERGLKLSGGQKQRLSIARALLKNPPIMIFDEATSALDSESEILVQEAIERLMHQRTSFVIAHRLSTIRNASRIIVLDRGEIVQIGSHDDLISTEGLYRKLYEMQFKL
jgi:ATP-binding cassette, subfamily B, bacterial MsbA